MERCNYISVDAPLNFIVFSTSGKSLYEFHPIKYVGSVPNSIVSSCPSRSVFSSCLEARVQVENYRWRCRHDEIQKSYYRLFPIPLSLIILLPYAGFRKRFNVCLVLIENDSLFKEEISSLFECDFVWFSIGLPVSVDSFLRGFIQSFSRFFVSLCLSRRSVLLGLKKKDVRMNLSRNRGNSCQNGFSLETWSRHGWL